MNYAQQQQKQHTQPGKLCLTCILYKLGIKFKENNNFFELGPLNSEQQQQFREKTIQTTQFDDMFTQQK